jgi:hypothetical protein
MPEPKDGRVKLARGKSLASLETINIWKYITENSSIYKNLFFPVPGCSPNQKPVSSAETGKHCIIKEALVVTITG